MEENILNLYGVYEYGEYCPDEEELVRLRNDQIVLYFLGIGSCVGWIFRKYLFSPRKKIIPKLLTNYSECVIMYTEIKVGDQYYQCGQCTQVYLKDILDQWFENNPNQLCPYCQTNSIDTNIVYANK